MSSSNTQSSKKRKRDEGTDGKKGSFIPVQGEVSISSSTLEDDEEVELVLLQLPSNMDLKQLESLPIDDKIVSSLYSTSQIIPSSSTSSSSTSPSTTTATQFIMHPSNGTNNTLEGLQLNILLPSDNPTSSSNKSSSKSSSSNTTTNNNYRIITRNFKKLIKVIHTIPASSLSTSITTNTNISNKSKSSSSTTNTSTPLTLANQTILKPILLSSRNRVPQNSTLAYRYRPIGSSTPSTANNNNNKQKKH